ncbi:hypothetical protein OGAPHI_003130 [Ogataea philodendri]|uniref:Uncharacterized protein n=1 Tax=Ogataea philodendri TaxID=1378263 RepID=A0A9P8P9A1_9ASCO|nr:uncharacterized protein OGAPHI_003130 [Ogataea philodendri]KAH3667481.1 hypothetical protein OGAPHI_003130 [Ogataea philodendri]
MQQQVTDVAEERSTRLQSWSDGTSSLSLGWPPRSGTVESPRASYPWQIGGWWLTCSTRTLYPWSGRAYSNVSPRSGLNGLAIRPTVETYSEAANAATYIIRVTESSIDAALSKRLAYSITSVLRCSNDVGSLKTTGRVILVMSFPTIDRRTLHSEILGLLSSFCKVVRIGSSYPMKVASELILSYLSSCLLFLSGNPFTTTESEPLISSGSLITVFSVRASSAAPAVCSDESADASSLACATGTVSLPASAGSGPLSDPSSSASKNSSSDSSSSPKKSIIWLGSSDSGSSTLFCGVSVGAASETARTIFGLLFKDFLSPCNLSSNSTIFCSRDCISNSSRLSVCSQIFEISCCLSITLPNLVSYLVMSSDCVSDRFVRFESTFMATSMT